MNVVFCICLLEQGRAIVAFADVCLIDDYDSKPMGYAGVWVMGRNDIRGTIVS